MYMKEILIFELFLFCVRPSKVVVAAPQLKADKLHFHHNVPADRCHFLSQWSELFIGELRSIFHANSFQSSGIISLAQHPSLLVYVYRPGTGTLQMLAEN